MEHQTSLMYVTMPNMKEAGKMAEKLVSERLAACVNLIPGMQSFYWWNGEIQQAQEVILLAKTTVERVFELTDFIRKHHPYDCPCVVELPIASGNPDFIQWIARETR
ncbi:MAG: divalent-cation tolerance protein CutA [SAR324 cluster bacterium]|nr:divalent-cation tolerance protein CutA [SAR324 cluster bacterium]